MEAVPRRTKRPEDVTGREDVVPGRLLFMAASMLAVPPRLAPRPEALVVALLLVPGRAKPVVGRPLLVMGRTA